MFQSESRVTGAHFIAMAKMVMHSAQIPELLQRYLVLIFWNQTQEQLYPSQVTIKNAVEQIYKEMFASVRTDPTSVEDTADESSDLTELDTQDGEVLKEKEVTGKEEDEEEGNKKEGNEEKGNE